MRKRGWSLAAVIMLWLVPAGPALAHAERSASTPDEGARVDTLPSTLNIQFTEPPIADANFEVLDGCERDLVQDIEVQGTEITATLAAGQPGDWTVRTQVVSGIDGHATKDQWRFQVAGQPDCAVDPDPGDPAAGGGEGDDQEGESFPLLAFAAGTLVLIALALMLRRKPPES